MHGTDCENRDESDVLSRISAEDRCHMGKEAWQDLPKRRDNLTHRVNDGSIVGSHGAD